MARFWVFHQDPLPSLTSLTAGHCFVLVLSTLILRCWLLALSLLSGSQAVDLFPWVPLPLRPNHQHQVHHHWPSSHLCFLSPYHCLRKYRFNLLRDLRLIYSPLGREFKHLVRFNHRYRDGHVCLDFCQMLLIPHTRRQHLRSVQESMIFHRNWLLQI